MPSTRKKLPRKLPCLLAIAYGCGGPNLSDVYVPRPKHENPGIRPTATFSYYGRKSRNNAHPFSSTSTSTSTCRGVQEEEGGARSRSSHWYSATTTFSQGASTSNSNSNSNSDSAVAAHHHHHLPSSPSKTTNAGSGGCRISRESVAVVKESKDPYLDFHHSILQMIVEKEIYAQDELGRLLHCFLSLNSPSNHPTIVHAFCDATAGAWWGRRNRVTRN